MWLMKQQTSVTLSKPSTQSAGRIKTSMHATRGVPSSPNDVMVHH